MPNINDFPVNKNGRLVALELYLKNLDMKDLNVELFGMQECERDRYWGFGVRNCYLIHFIIKGKGVFENSYGRHELSENMGFISVPGEKMFYKADSVDPWHYIWIGFNGNAVPEILESCSLGSENPTFTFDKNFDILSFFAEAEFLSTGREYYLLSILYKFFSLNKKEEFLNRSKIESAKNYIIRNYSDNITVQGVAESVFLERKYFSRLFKFNTGQTPQQYIQNVRMEQALKLLSSTTHSISDIAVMVDYDSVSSFSKAFKRRYSMTPSDITHGKHPPRPQPED